MFPACYPIGIIVNVVSEVVRDEDEEALEDVATANVHPISMFTSLCLSSSTTSARLRLAEDSQQRAAEPLAEQASACWGGALVQGTHQAACPCPTAALKHLHVS